MRVASFSGTCGLIQLLFPLMFVFGAISCTTSEVVMPDAIQSATDDVMNDPNVLPPALEEYLTANGFQRWELGIASPPEGIVLPTLGGAVTSSGCICGDLVGDQDVDLGDITFFVDHIFRAGPAPAEFNWFRVKNT